MISPMRKVVAEIFDTVKTEERIEALELLIKGQSIGEIAEELDMSYSSIHTYIENFEEAGLIERTDEGAELTEIGEFVEDTITELEELIEESVTERLEERVRGEFEERGPGFASPKGREVLERLLEEAKEKQEKE